jgi:hypothetical protein
LYRQGEVLRDPLISGRGAETMFRYATLQIAAGAAGMAVILALTGPSLAQEWTAFGIRKAGFKFDVPPGFTLDHIADDGQAATFLGPQEANLVVRGDPVSGGNFKQSVVALMADDEGHGWKLTYRRLTESWASYSGVKDGMIRYVRAIVTCGDTIAFFQIDYAQSEKVAYDPIVLRMVRSLDSDGC